MPAKGKKRKGTITINGKTVTKSYGAKGYTIRPGSKKGHSYCARSLAIQMKYGKTAANTMSRRAWGCRGKKSYKKAVKYTKVKRKKK